MNTSRLEKWMTAYERNLYAAVREHPTMYAFGDDGVPAVVRKMRLAFERGSYNHDGRVIAATCKDFGIKHTRKAIGEYLNALEPHDEAHVNAVMDAPMELTKGRNGWEAVSMIHIPGRPEEINTFGDHTTTHVRVTTCKSGSGGIYTSAHEVTNTATGWECMLNFSKTLAWENLGTSPDRCTEKSVALLHRICLSKLKELRPELFEVREVLTAIEANGAMPEGERNSDKEQLEAFANGPVAAQIQAVIDSPDTRKEPDASGADEDHDDAGRFLPVPADHYVGARV